MQAWNQWGAQTANGGYGLPGFGGGPTPVPVPQPGGAAAPVPAPVTGYPPVGSFQWPSYSTAGVPGQPTTAYPPSATPGQWPMANASPWEQYQWQYSQWQQQFGDKFSQAVTGVPPPATGVLTSASNSVSASVTYSTAQSTTAVAPPTLTTTAATSHANSSASTVLQTSSSNKRPSEETASDRQALNKKTKFELSTEGKETLEEITETEKQFDEQFLNWESQFNAWREQNANHPDSEQYKAYEEKWMAWRDQLLQRREQMRKRREAKIAEAAAKEKETTAGPVVNPIVSSTATPGPPPFSQPSPGVYSQMAYSGYNFPPNFLYGGQNFSQAPFPNVPQPVMAPQGVPPVTKPAGKSDTQDSKGVDFLKQTGSNGSGIPGLDLLNAAGHLKPYGDLSSMIFQQQGPIQTPSDSKPFDFPPPTTSSSKQQFAAPPPMLPQMNVPPPLYQTHQYNLNSCNQKDSKKSIPGLMDGLMTQPPFYSTGAGKGGCNNGGDRKYDPSDRTSENEWPSSETNRSDSRKYNNSGGGQWGSKENSFKSGNSSWKLNTQQAEPENEEDEYMKFHEYQEKGDEKPSWSSKTQPSLQKRSWSRFSDNDSNQRGDSNKESDYERNFQGPDLSTNDTQKEDANKLGSSSRWSENAAMEESAPVHFPEIIIDYNHRPADIGPPDVHEPEQMFDYAHGAHVMPHTDMAKLFGEEPLGEPSPKQHDLDKGQWDRGRGFEYGPPPRNFGGSYGGGGYDQRSSKWSPNNRWEDRDRDRRWSEGRRGRSRDSDDRGREDSRRHDRSRDREDRWKTDRSSRDGDVRSGDFKKDRSRGDDRKSYRSQSPNVAEPPAITPPIVELEEPKHVQVLVDDILCLPGRCARPSKIVLILRGPPGSGKSFVAKLIKDKELELGGSAPRILSLDDYFMVEIDKEEEDPDTGKKTRKKTMEYEYEPGMEPSYRSSLFKAFRKNVCDGYFPFIIVDSVHEKVSQFDQLVSFARGQGFQVYVCEMDMDLQSCLKRNIHKRSEKEIEEMIQKWEKTPTSVPLLDVRSLLQEAAIPEVNMEDSTEPVRPTDDKPEASETVANNSEDVKAHESDSEDKKEEDEDKEDSPEADDQLASAFASKWDNLDTDFDKLDSLDGLAKARRPRPTITDWLQLPENYFETSVQVRLGQKRVRWADLEERREQEKMRAIGFVVGQTDWNRMLDPSGGQSKLTQTKYI